MALLLPTPEDLHQLAADNYFELSQEELDAFQHPQSGKARGSSHMRGSSDIRYDGIIEFEDSIHRPTSVICRAGCVFNPATIAYF